MLRPTTITSINRRNAALAIPADTDIERVVNYDSADLNGTIALLLEITGKHSVFLKDFINFLLEKLNYHDADAKTKKYIQQLKHLDKKIEPSNYLTLDSYNICIKVLKIVRKLNIFEEGTIDKQLLDKALNEQRIKIIEKPWQDLHEKHPITIALWLGLGAIVLALLAASMNILFTHYIPSSPNNSYQCFPCDNKASCFDLNAQDNKSYFPVVGYTFITYYSGILAALAGLPFGLSLFACLLYLGSNKIALNRVERLIESKRQYINRLTANIADFSLLIFNIIVAPTSAYLYYRASKYIDYTAEPYMSYVNCSTPNSNLTLTNCRNFSGTIACSFDWPAARQHFNDQNTEVAFDIGLSTSLTVYSLIGAIFYAAFLIMKLKNLLNHAADASQKARVSFFANPTDIENRDLSRNVTQSLRADRIEAIEMEDVSKKSAKISRAEVTQMLTTVRGYSA